METRYSGATWRPLGTQTEPLIGTPRVLIFHTMVGGLLGTDSMFRRNEYTGTESHFGVGGPADGPSLDGDVWQWQSIDRQADAQNAGNAYATSVETSDGGHPETPWSEKQLAALVSLTVWWCRQTGHPARIVAGPGESGIGYHAQFKDWAPDGRPCPGPVRIAQLRDDVLPRVRLVLAPPIPPVNVHPGKAAPVVASVARLLRLTWPRRMRGDDVRAVQVAAHAPADGVYGPVTRDAVRHVQATNGLAVDGVVGPMTCRALGLRWTGGR